MEADTRVTDKQINPLSHAPAGPRALPPSAQAKTTTDERLPMVDVHFQPPTSQPDHESVDDSRDTTTDDPQHVTT